MHSHGLRTGVQCTVRLPLVQALAAKPAYDPSVTIAGVRILALTGCGRPKDAELAAGAGFTAYIRKPVAIEDLLKRIMSLPIGNLIGGKEQFRI